VSKLLQLLLSQGKVRILVRPIPGAMYWDGERAWPAEPGTMLVTLERDRPATEDCWVEFSYCGIKSRPVLTTYQAMSDERNIRGIGFMCIREKLQDGRPKAY
jgi:hypothetical protein